MNSGLLFYLKQLEIKSFLKDEENKSVDCYSIHLSYSDFGSPNAFPIELMAKRKEIFRV